MTWTNLLSYHHCPISKLLEVKAADVEPADFIIIRDRLLVAWNDSKAALTAAKDLEMGLRTASAYFITDPDQKKGTENVELGNGYAAKVVKKVNYNFVKNAEGKVDTAAIERALSELEREPGGADIASRLVKWDATLTVSEYDKLPQHMRQIVDKIVVTTDGAPTLEIKAPKAPKAAK